MDKRKSQVFDKCHYCWMSGCQLIDWKDETCKSRQNDSCTVCGGSFSHNHKLCSKCIIKANSNNKNKLNNNKSH